MKKFFIIIVGALLLSFIGCGSSKSSEDGKALLKHTLQLVGIPQEIVLNICQDTNDNGSCDVNELQAKIRVNKSDSIAQMWEKVKFDNEGRYILENYDPTKSIIMEIKDTETLKYDNSKLSLRYNPDSEELSVLQALIDADFLTEDETKALKASDNRNQVDKILLDSLRINQNLLKDENLSTKNALSINLEEIAKGLIESNVTKELPARLNACNNDNDCLEEIVKNTVKEVELTKEKAQELAKSKSIVDAYIIKLLKPVIAVCANGKTYQSSLKVGKKGKIIFDKFPVGTECTITVASGATIDSNNNGKVDETDTILAFDMIGSSSDTHITPLTTLLIKKRLNGVNVEVFQKMIQNFDPVVAPNRIITNRGIEKVKIEKLIVLAEVLKVSMKQFSDISQLTLSGIINTQSGETIEDLDIDKLIQNLPSEIKENLRKRANSTKKLLTMLKNLDQTKISLNDFFVAFSDGGKGIEDALKDALFVPLPEGVSILDFIIKPKLNEDKELEEQELEQLREDIKAEIKEEIISVNHAPFADAGEDKTIFIGDTFTLDGSKSKDGDGTVDIYEWWKNEKLVDNGVSITLDDLPVGLHVFTLVVKDDQGAVGSDSVIIRVNSKEIPPNDRPDNNVTDNNPSNDRPDNNITDNNPPNDRPDNNVTNNNPSNDRPDNNVTNNNPSNDRPDNNVTNNNPPNDSPENNATESNTTDNNPTVINQAPTANAGGDQTVIERADVAFNGSSSFDSDGTIVSYEWKNGSNILSNSISFSSNDLNIGVHTITLTVTDNEGLKGSDDIIITVNRRVDQSTN